jgi:toxin CptA
VYTLMREIELKPSRRLGWLQAGMAALALLAVGLAALPAGWHLALGAGVIGLVIGAARRAAPITRLRIGTDGGLQCQDADGEWRDMVVLDDSFVSPMLIVLRDRVDGGAVRTRVLLPDSAPADDLRRLRVSLRWARRTRSDTTAPGAG